MADQNKRVLLVDDDPILLRVVTRVLQNEGYEIETAPDGAEAVRRLADRAYDVVMTDLLMEPVDGLAVLDAARRAHAATPVIIITACQAIDRALAAMRSGAFDYVVKPVRMDVIRSTLARALHYREHVVAEPAGTNDAGPATRMRDVVAESPAMRRACALAERLALANVPVLLVGEKGTGKERLAAAIHEESHRCTQFVAIPCPGEAGGPLDRMLAGRSLPFSRGDTVYLAGIDGLSHAQQRQLLKHIRDQDESRGSRSGAAHVDVRLIFSAARPLQDLAAGHVVLPEMENRLSAVSIHLPPLNDRTADVVPLARLFLAREVKKINRSMAFSGETEDILAGSAWPGNADDLEEAVRAAAETCAGAIIERAHLPERLRSAPAATRPRQKAPAAAEKLRGEAFTSFIKSRQKQMMPPADGGASAQPRA
jgi:DNA-binding NtrC family response regulator